MWGRGEGTIFSWDSRTSNGGAAGETQDNPLLPDFVGQSFVYNFKLVTLKYYFIDTEIATGYDYSVSGDPLFNSVIAQGGINSDNMFDLYFSTDSSCRTDSFTQLADHIFGNSEYTFPSPQSCFSIRDIEETANLDLTNSLALVTGVSFDTAGVANVTQTPILTTVGGPVSTSVPGPLPLLGIGAAFSFSRKLRKRIKGSKQDEVLYCTQLGYGEWNVDNLGDEGSWPAAIAISPPFLARPRLLNLDGGADLPSLERLAPEERLGQNRRHRYCYHDFHLLVEDNEATAFPPRVKRRQQTRNDVPDKRQGH
jgi:hypothetical protein